MPIDKELATLAAAVIAATTSLAVLIINVFTARTAARRDAYRKLFGTEINALGGCIYAIAAYCQTMLKAKTDVSFAKSRSLAAKEKKKLTALRSTLRYSLWGIDDALREMGSAPFHIYQYKNRRRDQVARDIMAHITALREALDETILVSYTSGKAPTWWRRRAVARRARQLRKCAEAGDPRRQGTH